MVYSNLECNFSKKKVYSTAGIHTTRIARIVSENSSGSGRIDFVAVKAGFPMVVT